MERYAGALHHLGVRKGDRVTIFAHNGMDYLLGLFACWRIGAIAALVNVRFADELDYYFADHEPSVVIYTHDMLDPVRRASLNAPTVKSIVCMDGPQPNAESLPDLLKADLKPPPDPADEDAIAHLSYTSGTTGKPKGACLAHEPTMRAANCIAERLRITSDDVSFGPTALSSSYQLVGNLLPPLHRGATVNVMGRWTQKTGWDALENAKATILVGNPTLLTELLIESRSRGRMPGKLRLTVSGGAPVPPTLKRALARRMAIAARRELWPERARRLHGAGRSRAGVRRQARRGRPAVAGQGGSHSRRRRQGMPDGRSRRSLPARRLHEGLLGQAGQDRGGAARRLAALGRRRLHGPRWLYHHARTLRGIDQGRRSDLVSARRGGGALHASPASEKRPWWRCPTRRSASARSPM